MSNVILVRLAAIQSSYLCLAVMFFHKLFFSRFFLFVEKLMEKLDSEAPGGGTGLFSRSNDSCDDFLQPWAGRGWRRHTVVPGEPVPAPPGGKTNGILFFPFGSLSFGSPFFSFPKERERKRTTKRKGGRKNRNLKEKMVALRVGPDILSFFSFATGLKWRRKRKGYGRANPGDLFFHISSTGCLILCSLSPFSSPHQPTANQGKRGVGGRRRKRETKDSQHNGLPKDFSCYPRTWKKCNS